MFVKLAELSKENKELQAENVGLKEKVAAFEKQAAAEKFLVDLKENPGAPISLRPSTPEDFLEKRAALAAHTNLESAELAVKLAQRQDFEIGEVADSSPQPSTGEGQADQIMGDWLSQYL